MPISLLALFWGMQQARRTREAAAYAFTWGTGYFCANISWVYISLHTYGGMPIWMAAASTLAFALFLATFPALAALLARRLPCKDSLRYTLLAPTLFMIFEWIRGWIFTGFPWASVGGSQLETLSGLYPIIGSYGAGFVLCLIAAVLLSDKRLGLSLAFAAISSSTLLNHIDWTSPQGAPVKVSLLQGNIAQSMKWNQAAYIDSLGAYMNLAQQAKGQLIVFPETAIPSFLEAMPDWYLGDLRALMAQKKAAMILGVATSNDDSTQHFNAAVDLSNPKLNPYEKQHLVPFGEYIPLPQVFGPIYQFLDMPLLGLNRGEAIQTPFALAGGKIAANICYEDAFGNEIRRNAVNATLLANLTNMAWFDGSWAAEQHAEMARARALENARYLIRATNTGKTAIIDNKGRIAASLPPQQRAVLEGEVQHRSGTTPYQIWGDWLIVSIWLSLVLGLIIWHRKSNLRVSTST